MVDNLWQCCKQTAVYMMDKYGWQLCTAEQLTAAVFDRAQVMAQPGKTINFTQLTLSEYALVLHRTCQPQQALLNRAAQNRAYEEIGRYLYNMMHKLRPVWPETDKQEAVQMALMKIYEALSDNKVQEPRAFWAFAFNKLRGEIKRLERQSEIGGQEPVAIGVEMAEDEAEGVHFTYLSNKSLPPMEQDLMRQQICQSILRHIQQIFKEHPRAKQQLLATLLKYAFDCSNAEIARLLAMPDSSIASVIARGKKKFQTSEALADLWQELFELELS